MELGLVVGVHQGQLLEGVGHGVDLLPLGPRGPLHLRGGGLVQHVLRGGGPILLNFTAQSELQKFRNNYK